MISIESRRDAAKRQPLLGRLALVVVADGWRENLVRRKNGV